MNMCHTRADRMFGFTYVFFLLIGGTFAAENATEMLLPSFMSNIPMVTRILIENSTFVIVNSQKPPYFGYISKLGDRVTITCRIESPADKLLFFRFYDDGFPRLQDLIPDGSRVIERRTDKWVNVTILALTSDDSGRYKCVNDIKDLVVFDKTKVPAVVGQKCVSHGYSDLVCSFFTNSTKYSLTEWTVLWSTSSNKVIQKRWCLQRYCANIECTEDNQQNQLEVSQIGPQNKFQILTCTIHSFVFVSVTYLFEIKGNNSIVGSSQTISATLDGSIVILESPELYVVNSTSSSIEIRVELSHRHRNEEGEVIGHLRFDIETNGILYQVWYSCEIDGERVVSMLSHRHIDFIKLDRLRPFTDYTIRVGYQLAETMYKDNWSVANRIAHKTAETYPEVSPEISSVGYSVINSSSACRGRLVTLFWKVVPMSSGYGNGLMKSYVIFDLTNSVLTEGVRYENVTKLLTVNGNQTSAALCLGMRKYKLGIAAINLVGEGPISQQIILPSIASTIPLKECEISASKTPDGTLNIMWSSGTGSSFNHTVFVCKPSDVKGNECATGTISWYDVPPSANKYVVYGDLAYNNYRVGLVRYNAEGVSSGIVWTNCIAEHSTVLRPLSFTLQIEGVEATVNIRSVCGARNTAVSHKLYYCPINSLTDSCLDLEYETLSPCDTTIVLTLSRYSQEYAFWIRSDFLNSSIESQKDYKKTAAREYLSWEIALIVAGVFVFLIAVFLGVLFIHKQLLKIRSFKEPHIILPTPLPLDEEVTASASDTENDHQSLLELYTKAVLPKTPCERQSPNGSCSSRMFQPDWTCGEAPNYHSNDAKVTNKLAVDLLERNGLSGYSKSSYKQIPEDYLQCTNVDTDQSALTAFSGEVSSGNSFIDISQFLSNSGVKICCPQSEGNNLSDLFSDTKAKKLFIDLPEKPTPIKKDILYVKLPQQNESHNATNSIFSDYMTTFRPLDFDSSYKAMPDSESVEVTNGRGNRTVKNLSCDEDIDNESDSSISIANSIYGSSMEFSVSDSGGTSGDSGYNDGQKSEICKAEAKVKTYQDASKDNPVMNIAEFS